MNPYLAEFDAFAEAIRKCSAGVDAEADLLRTMRIVEAAYATAQSGHRQRIDS